MLIHTFTSTYHSIKDYIVCKQWPVVTAIYWRLRSSLVTSHSDVAAADDDVVHE